jgi:FixJ family two-component response regulator
MSSALALAEHFRPMLNGAQPSAGPNVFIVDADASARNEATAMVREAGWSAESFATIRSFLDCAAPTGPCCLIFELTATNLSGLEVLARSAIEPLETPVIFITDRFDVRLTARAMKAGAVELLSKPIDQDALLKAVRNALDASEDALAAAAETRRLQARYAALSGREREVTALVVTGLMKRVGCEASFLSLCRFLSRFHVSFCSSVLCLGCLFMCFQPLH